MLQIKVDPHTHTLFSGHAFGTVAENFRAAADQGMEGLAITEHFSPLFTEFSPKGFPQMGGTLNMDDLPGVIYGVKLFIGIEIDIVDIEGHLAFWDKPSPFRRPAGTGADKEAGPGPLQKKGSEGKPALTDADSLADMVLGSRDFSIASIHGRPPEASIAASTDMYIDVMHHPHIHAIGHPIRAGVPFEWDAFLDACKETGVMPEVNEHSLDYVGIDEKVSRFAERCAEKGVKIIVGSDAHSPFKVGVFEKSLTMLEAIHFPQELIGNYSLSSFTAAIKAIDAKKA